MKMGKLKKVKKVRHYFRGLALLLASCGPQRQSYDWVEGFSTPVLREAVQTFDSEIKDVNTEALSILFVSRFSHPSPPPFAIALYYKGTNRIEILSKYQNSAKIELIVFHEMGHWQGLDHDDTTDNLMNSTASWYNWQDPEVRAALMQDLRDRL